MIGWSYAGCLVACCCGWGAVVFRNPKGRVGRSCRVVWAYGASGKSGVEREINQMRKGRDVPLISIGMPVFNGAKFMRESIESILAQSFEDFELIISDNGSTDDTPDIASEFARVDDRIRYIRLKKNIGAAKNYNRVFNQSTGTYFKWAPHDDLIAPKFLRKCLDGFDACDPSTIIVYPQSKFIDESGGVISYPLRLHEMQSNSRFAARRTFRVLRAIGLVTSILGLMRKEAARRTRLIDSCCSRFQILLFYLKLQCWGKLLILTKFCYLDVYMVTCLARPIGAPKMW